MVFPLTISETVLVAAGVLNPATTARTRERFGSFGSDSSAGASTLSTVQLGGAAALRDGVQSQLHAAGQYHVGEVGGHGGALHIAEEMKIDGHL